MKLRHSRLVCILVSLLTLLCMPVVAQTSGMRTWTDSTGQHETEAIFIQLREGKVYLEKEDGSVVVVPLERLSSGDQAFLRDMQKSRVSDKSTTPNKGTGPATMQLDLSSDGKPDQNTDNPVVREAVVTGAGLDPERALQAAFSQAIEQTVGVLVDSETLVENDEIVRDKVLTFSRAYVQDFDVLKQWEEDGLHRATIRANVSIAKLVERLTASNIAVKEVPGLKMKLQAEHSLASESNAAEMFANAMEQYHMDQLWEVVIDGKPEVISKDSTHAKLAVKVTITSNARNWNNQLPNLRQVLDKVAMKQSAFTCSAGRYHYGLQPRIIEPTTQELRKRIGNDGASGARALAPRTPAPRRVIGGFPKPIPNSATVALLTSMNRSLTNTKWKMYRVPDSLTAVLEDVRARKWQLVVVLAGQDNSIFAKEVQNMSRVGRDWESFRCAPFHCFITGMRTDILSPLLWVGSGLGGADSFRPSQGMSFEIDVPLEELDNITKCAASFEEITDE